MTDPSINNPSTAVREFDFDQPVVNIGSNPDNDVIIAGKGVMPFHASFLRENGSFSIIPMSPEAEIQLDGKLLRAGSASLSENQCVTIGDHSLYLQKGMTPVSIHLTVYKSTGGPIETPLELNKTEGEQCILVNLVEQHNIVEVDQNALYEFEVINGGQYVASFQIVVQGVPGEWVQITPRFVNLNESQRALVRVSITPPREPTSTAGTHALNIVVTSPNYPRQRCVTPIELTIQPYYEFMASNLTPRQQHIRWRDHKGIVHLPIYNNSNCTADFSVMAIDEENGCTFDFEVDENVRHTRQTSVSIDAGETCNLPIEITPNRQPIISIRNKHYHYTTNVQVTGQPVSPQTLSGTTINHPLLGWLAVLLSVLLVVMGLFFLVQPRINSFQVAASKDVIELGDTTNLEWSVSPFATRLSISNVDKEITRSMNHITVAPDRSTTYELVSGNWISGMLGMDYTKRVTVLVVPPSPNIAVFDIDKKEVDKGNPIKIRWSVTDTDKLVLTIDEVVYDLTAEEFSGERSVVMEEDSIVSLEASNLSGSELRSYYVNVAPPNIVINSYTVWVRPEGSAKAALTSNSSLASAASAGRAGLAAVPAMNNKSVMSATDSGFSQKFVELVKDDTSDTGYKVVFYQPNRELAKGEQVMLEWDVDGVDKLSIAPFTQELPAKGKQPFFPQESMNFVLTAKSGDLEKLFMLPVNVFDGEPPTAPKIDFFKAVPTKMVGSGSVQFSWSVSGEWTHIQLAKGTNDGEEVVADWINPQGFKKVTVTESGTFLLKAWNGDLSTAQPVDITVDPALKKINLNINDVYTDAGRFMVGRSVIVTVGFDKIPTDSPKPTGKITVTDGYSTCTINLPALSCELTFITPGDKTITASYEGDSVYLQADSAPYPQTIVVESAEVELIPRYFVLGTDTPISDITDASTNGLNLDSGLRIIVEVRPKNINVPDDSMSKVSVSICDQDSSGALIEGTCEFVADGTAVVATETDSVGRQIGKFYVDVSIYGFTQPGTHLFLFDYSHQEGTINPSSFEQPNVPIGKIHFHLSSQLCDKDPIEAAFCKFGSTDTTTDKMTFDLHTSGDVDIPTTLPAPDAADLTISPVGKSGATIAPLTCSVEKPNGVYKLVCETSAMTSADNTWTMNYAFDNNSSDSYIMDVNTGSFTMDVLNTTKIVFTDPGNIQVGQVIQLTGSGGLISVVDQVTGNTLSVPLTVSVPSGANAANLGCSSAENCDDSSGSISITSSTSNSFVYLRKAGKIEITASYAGDGTNYLGVSANHTLTVAQLGGITAEWKSQSGAWPTDMVINSPMNARIQLSVPSTTFSKNVLIGRKLMVKFTNQTAITNCTIGAAGTGTEGEYLVTITTLTSEPVADFTITCGSGDTLLPFNAELEIDFVTNGEDTEGDDFAFDPAADIDEDLTVKKNDTSALETYLYLMPVTTSSVNMTENTSSVIQFLAGEKYQLNFKLKTIFGYYNSWGGAYSTSSQVINDYTINNDNDVLITFPPAVENAIDWNKSTCGVKNDTKVKLDVATDVIQHDYVDRSWDWAHAHWDYWRWGYVYFTLTSRYPCYLVFNSDIALNQNITFSFTSHNAYYSASNSYTTTGVAKQNVNMKFTPVSPYIGLISVPQVITINLASTTNPSTTLALIDPTLTDFDSQFSVTPSCGTVTGKKINSTSQAQFTLSSSTECLSQTLSIDYLQNEYFNKIEDQVYTFTFNKHASAVSLEYYNGSAWVTGFPFSSTSNAVQNTTYKFRVKAADNDGLGHTDIPSGTVKVKVNGSATCSVTNSSGGTVTLTGGYYELGLDGSGYAEFTINFSSTASGISIQYEYPGSDTFQASLIGTSSSFNVVAP